MSSVKSSISTISTSNHSYSFTPWKVLLSTLKKKSFFLWTYDPTPMPHGVFLFPLAQNKKCTKKFTAFLGISSRVETRGGNRLKKGGKFWTRPAICSFALDISTIGQQFQHFFVTLSAPVLHLSFAFHFAFVCRLEIYEAPSTVFAQRGE